MQGTIGVDIAEDRAFRVNPACPPWCAIPHDHEVDGGEHQSAGVEVPALLSPLGSSAGIASSPYSSDLVVVLRQAQEGGITWVYVGDGQQQGIELSIGSAVNLIRSLQSILAPDAEVPAGRGRAA